MDLIHIYRTFYPKAAEYTFFSSACEIFSEIDHMWGHKTNLNKLKKTDIISNIFPDHKSVKPGINYKKKTKQNHKCVEIKQHTTGQPMSQWRNQRRNLKKNLETNENGNTTIQNL